MPKATCRRTAAYLLMLGGLSHCVAVEDDPVWMSDAGSLVSGDAGLDGTGGFAGGGSSGAPPLGTGGYAGYVGAGGAGSGGSIGAAGLGGAGGAAGFAGTAGTGGLGGAAGSGGFGGGAGAGGTGGAGGMPACVFPFPCATGGASGAGGGSSGTGGSGGASDVLPGFTPSPNNPPQCPAGAPANPLGDCLGLPIYINCQYTNGMRTYSCTCDWYHWICI